jgi:hypothetical protein
MSEALSLFLSFSPFFSIFPVWELGHHNSQDTRNKRKRQIHKKEKT